MHLPIVRTVDERAALPATVQHFVTSGMSSEAGCGYCQRNGPIVPGGSVVVRKRRSLPDASFLPIRRRVQKYRLKASFAS